MHLAANSTWDASLIFPSMIQWISSIIPGNIWMIMMLLKYITIYVERLLILEIHIPGTSVIDSDIAVSESKLLTHINVHFQTNTHEKDINCSDPLLYFKSNHYCSIHEWLWHYITHETWYVIKLNKQNEARYKFWYFKIEPNFVYVERG